MNIKDQIRAEIDARRQNMVYELYGLPEDGEKYIRVKGMHDAYVDMLTYIEYHLPEQPVIDHHEIEVEFRGEKVTISREFYRDGEMNYSTSEQDDNAIWSALRAWCEKKGITPFELYPKQSEQPVEGPEETADLLAIAHLQGMEQQKAKMLEGAVEGEIQMRYSGCLCAKTIRSINEDKFKLGDKVKIIIVKEDENWQ